MTKDEIIEMARQAGFETMFHKGRIHGFERDGDYTEELEDFAKLVEDAAFKRWAAQTKLVVQDEREACAKVCDDFEFQDDSAGTLDAVSKAIRART